MTTNIGHCKDCKWWEADDQRDTAKWAECGFDDNSFYDYTWGRHTHIAEDTMCRYAVADDDQGLQHGMKTGRLFGCLKFVQYIKRT